MFECSAQYTTENLIKAERESKRSREHGNCHTHIPTRSHCSTSKCIFTDVCFKLRQEYKAYPKRQNRGVKMDVEGGEKRDLSINLQQRSSAESDGKV